MSHTFTHIYGRVHVSVGLFAMNTTENTVGMRKLLSEQVPYKIGQPILKDPYVKSNKTLKSSGSVCAKNESRLFGERERKRGVTYHHNSDVLHPILPE